MNYNLEINHEIKLIWITYSGVVEKQDLAEVWRHLLSLKEFTSLKYNLLSDYRNSKFDISVDDTDGMWQFLESIKSILNGKKECAILNNPYDTAISMLFQIKTLKKLGYSVKLFSTEEAALKWIAD